MELPGPSLRESTPDGFDVLAELAFDLRTSWNHEADDLWSRIDPDLWRDTGNAWLVLRTASAVRLRELWADVDFRARAERVRDERQRGLRDTSWFAQAHAESPLTSVAFFSLEFALSEALPIYSGGLGNVAGDYLKSASDLGVPLVGVGLLYQQGYFRQVVGTDGAQREFYPYNDVSQLPVAPVRDERGEWIRVVMPRPGRRVWLRAWGARVGRLPLYLLDSNDPSNAPADRGITAQLYGGGSETRLLQEMALGIGGWRLLRALGLDPEVCHLNEGHAALVTLERARDFMRAKACSFGVALAATRAGNVFTTHTPVEAGFDRFAPDLVAALLGAYARDELRLPLEEMLALGRSRAEDESEPMSMAWLALRGSGAANAVSRRHGEVSRRIFQPLFPRWPEPEVPIGHVTNGVHVPSWDSAEADDLWTKACGVDRWRGTMQGAGKIADRTDAELWALRSKARAHFVEFVRERFGEQLEAAGVAGEALESTRRVLDPDALTIGMARRFTAYKRPTLLLHDEDRFARLLANRQRPVQIVVAGKAHPRDTEGKGLVQAWVRFMNRLEIRARAVFLADYDMRLAERLVQGVDLWVNTPRPPWEACGTSGMKVLVNGGINFSSLDGWWAEAFNPEVGWHLDGDGRDDSRDAGALYDRLEREIVPAFYDRDPAGLPRAWIARMRGSMSSLTPTYSSNRTLRAYADTYYVPAARRFARRAADGAAAAVSLEEWERSMRSLWPTLRLGELRVRTEAGLHRFSADVFLDEIDPNAVAVELYAEPDGKAGPFRASMRRDAPLSGARGYVYVADVPGRRPAADYTPRVIPAHPEASVPLELPLIAWPG